VAGPDAGGDGAVDAHARLSFKEGDASGLGVFQARLAFTMAAFNVLVQWHGLQPCTSGLVPLSIAEFSLLKY
jgi:hypothetical protein